MILVEIFPSLFTRKNSGTVDITDGSTVKSVAFTLKDDAFIVDPYGFIALVYLTGSENKLKSGKYVFNNLSNAFQIINELRKGGVPEEITVTIPEGYTVKDISKKLFDAGIALDESQFVTNALPYEGYLFPDTYKFLKESSSSEIIDKMKKRFNEMLPDNFELLAKNKGLTLKEAIILASIVEREVQRDKDRPLAASVFLNRLHIRMLLQADSTILYVLSEHKEWFSPEDYQIDSPYNTYKYAGLPPAPISNPGIKSIESVINAPETGYYYFMTKPDGEAVFEKTLEEHDRDIAKYYGQY